MIRRSSLAKGCWEIPAGDRLGIAALFDLKQLRGRGEEAAQAVYDAEIAPKFAEATEAPK